MAQSSSHLVHRDFVLLCGAQQREAARDEAKGVEALWRTVGVGFEVGRKGDWVLGAWVRSRECACVRACVRARARSGRFRNSEWGVQIWVATPTFGHAGSPN